MKNRLPPTRSRCRPNLRLLLTGHTAFLATAAVGVIAAAPLSSCTGRQADRAQATALELEVARLKLQVEQAESAALAAAAGRDEALQAQTDAESSLRSQREQPEVLDQQIADLTLQLNELSAEYKDYRIRYKQSVRKVAVGMKFSSLDLGQDLQFENVRISSLDPERLGISTDSGVKSIPLSALPELIAWKLGHDPEGEASPSKPVTVDEIAAEIENLVQARQNEKLRFTELLRSRSQLIDEEISLQKKNLPIPGSLRGEVARLDAELTQSNTTSAEIIKEINKRIMAINRRRR